jgi:hypothetical protein
MVLPEGAGRKPPRASFRSFLGSAAARHDLVESLSQVRDGRRPGVGNIPLAAVLLAGVLGFASGLRAVRSWEERLRYHPAFRELLRVAGHQASISDDTFALALDGASLADMQAILRAQAKRELLRWPTGPHATSRLGRELVKLNARALAAWPVIAIDGHCLFTCRKEKCASCLVIGNCWGHKVVVAQWVGTHPAMVVDFEPMAPGDNECTAATRLLMRIKERLQGAFKVVLLDAFYDHEPMRAAITNADLHYVIRHKDPRRQPGGDGLKALAARDPNRMHPDAVFRRRDGQRVEVWQQFEAPDGRRTVVFRRPETKTVEGACVTNLPAAVAPPAAVATMMMERWSQENTGFHEMAGQLNLDRAYVHKSKANASWTVVALALIAYNAWQAYLYKVLGIEPMRPARTWRDLQFDMWAGLGTRHEKAGARATGPP